MPLSSFILNNIDAILQEWMAFAFTLVPVKYRADQAVLLDDARFMLETIAADLALPQSALEQEEKSKGHRAHSLAALAAGSAATQHGIARMHYGFSLIAALSEYRALRASVTRLWERAPDNHPMAPAAVTDLIRFNEAIDQSLSESVTGYYLEQEQKDRLFNALLSSTPDLCYTIDVTGRFTYANKAFLELVDMPLAELLKRHYDELQRPHHEDLGQQWQLAVAARQQVRGEVRYVLPSGSEDIYETILVPVCNAEGIVEAVAATARNITDRKTEELRNWQQANFDPLTGLPNRSLFQDRLAHEVRHAARSGTPIALLFVDLDKFKEINDLYGHDTGDELLRAASTRMRACLRETDTVARLGGDEFTIILQDLGEAGHVEQVAKKILEQMAQPFHLGDHAVGVSVSIGIALAPQDASTPGALIHNADQAMYASKQAGGNRLQFYSAR